MNTFRQLTYMVLDELKGISDDFTYTENHVIYLLGKFRALLLKQRYSDLRKQIPESDYQTLCLTLTKQPTTEDNTVCNEEPYLKSNEKIPVTMLIGNPKIYPVNYYQTEVTFIGRERMKYVGHNKYLQNIIYCSIGPDGYLYMKSSNPQFLYLQKVKALAVFEDVEQAANLQCSEDGTQCDILDKEFPIEEALVSTLIELTVKELAGVVYRPKDEQNDAKDDLSGLAVQQPKS